jgi:hypothetical protein
MKVKRLETAKDTDIARIQAQERIVVERDRQRAELKLQKIKLQQEKMRMEYELKLAQLQANNNRGPFATGLPFTATTDQTGLSGPSSSSSTSFNSPVPTHLGSLSLELGNMFNYGDEGQMAHTPLLLPDHTTADDGVERGI